MIPVIATSGCDGQVVRSGVDVQQQVTALRRNRAGVDTGERRVAPIERRVAPIEQRGGLMVELVLVVGDGRRESSRSFPGVHDARNGTSGACCDLPRGVRRSGGRPAGSAGGFDSGSRTVDQEGRGVPGSWCGRRGRMLAHDGGSLREGVTGRSGPIRARRRGEDGRVSTPLELLFDLCFRRRRRAGRGRPRSRVRR